MVQVKQVEDENLCSKYTANEHSKAQKSCIKGIRIPLYQFGRHSDSSLENIFFNAPSCVPLEEQTLLESLLLAKWEERLSEGLFRYDVTQSEIKVIVGRIKFLAQLNESWTNTSLSQYEEKRKCDQGSLFQTNWLKRQEELLFCIASGENTEPKLISAALVPNSSILVIINATPVEYGHVVMLPCGVNGHLQFLEDRSVEMLLRIAVEIKNFALCLFYEFSTPRTACVYFQALFFSSLLPVEAMTVDTFFSDRLGGIYVSSITGYPVKTLLFERSCNLKKTGEFIAEICSHLQEKCILYNLLIRDCGKKIFLFLQRQGSDKPSILSPWECWGYFLFKSRSEFDQATEDALLDRLAAASLDDAEFQGVKQFCCHVASKVSF